MFCFRFAGAAILSCLVAQLAGLAILVQRARAQEPACAGTLTAEALNARIDALIARMTPEERIAQLQDRAPAIPRLGIPVYNWWNEGLHGIARNGYATVFPQAIGLAATADPELMRQVGEVVSTEARAKFNAHIEGDSSRYAGLTIWSPNINMGARAGDLRRRSFFDRNAGGWFYWRTAGRGRAILSARRRHAQALCRA